MGKIEIAVVKNVYVEGEEESENVYMEDEEEVELIYVSGEEEVYLWTAPTHYRWEIGFVLTIDRGRVDVFKIVSW